MKAKVFCIDTTTFGGKHLSLNFYVPSKNEPKSIAASVKEIMSSIGKTYSIYVSTKDTDVDDSIVKEFAEIKSELEDIIGVNKSGDK